MTGSTSGNSFTVTGGDRVINALGIPDLNDADPSGGVAGDGLTTAHQVAIWEDNGATAGTQVALATVDSSSFLDGIWRWTFLESEVTLLNGVSYRIALDDTLNDSDCVLNNTIGFTASSGIGSVVAAFNTGASFAYPGNNGGGTIYAAPNAALIPEPSALLLSGLGSVLIFGRRRRRSA